MTDPKKIPDFIQFHWDTTRFINRYQEGLKNAASRAVVITVVKHIEAMTEASFFPSEDVSF